MSGTLTGSDFPPARADGRQRGSAGRGTNLVDRAAASGQRRSYRRRPRASAERTGRCRDGGRPFRRRQTADAGADDDGIVGLDGARQRQIGHRSPPRQGVGGFEGPLAQPRLSPGRGLRRHLPHLTPPERAWCRRTADRTSQHRRHRTSHGSKNPDGSFPPSYLATDHLLPSRECPNLSRWAVLAH